jgi:hypothetical protein
MRPHRPPRSTQAVLPPSLKAARCRWYPRRSVSERCTRCPVTSARAPRGLRARRAAPDARCGTARHARGAGAQNLQQIELRQRSGDRAVELVPVEIPATCMLCAEYWKGTCWVLTEHEPARGYCERYRVSHGAGPLPGGCCQRTHSHMRRGYAHRSATVHAGARRGAYGHQRAGAPSQAHGAA